MSKFLQYAIRGAAARPASVALPITIADSFPKQWNEYVNTRHRFNGVCCSRRSGKTNGAVIDVGKKCSERPGYRVLYINQTALQAELQMFRKLLKFLDKKRIPYRADRANLLVFFDNGSFFQAMGCNDVGAIKTKLGDGWDHVIVDEMQSYADRVLKELIDSAILPMVIDRSGSVTLQGTPGRTKAGFWYDIVHSGKSGFHMSHWTLFDNPLIDHDWQTVYASRGLTEKDAAVQREVFGKWETDPDSIVFCYDEKRNSWPLVDGVPTLPEQDPEHWRYCLGMDLGFHDATAIVVLGWREDDGEKRLWEVYSWQERGLDYFAVAAKFKEVVEKWLPSSICIDTGGAGARQMVESLKTLFGAFKYTTKPKSVLDSIGLVNDEFRTGRLKVDPRGLIAHDAAMVIWKEGKHEVEVCDSFHSDIMDALRYAHSCAWHYHSEAPPPEESEYDRRTRELERAREIAEDPYNPYRNCA